MYTYTKIITWYTCLPISLHIFLTSKEAQELVDCTGLTDLMCAQQR